jgi:hypothetical protein
MLLRGALHHTRIAGSPVASRKTRSHGHLNAGALNPLRPVTSCCDLAVTTIADTAMMREEDIDHCTGRSPQKAVESQCRKVLVWDSSLTPM